MAGICLCRYNDCPKNGSCKRFLTGDNDMASYAEFQNICSEENGFKYYWSNIATEAEKEE